VDRVCGSADFVGWPVRARVADRISGKPEEIGSGQGERHREICGAGSIGIVARIQFRPRGNAARARRELLVEEANSIITTGRRAQLLPEPHAANVAQLLREYVPLRIEAHREGQFSDKFATMRKRSAELQDHMWAEAVAAAAEQSIFDYLRVSSPA
jgi:hypothetical protein